MAHVRPGKTAKRNRRLKALARLQKDRSHVDEMLSLVTTKALADEFSRLSKEIAILEDRV